MSTRFEIRPGALLTVFILTAIATAAAQFLPSSARSLGLILDLVPVAGVVTATALAIRTLSGASRSRGHLIAAVYGYFAGGLVGAFGVAHTASIVVGSVRRATLDRFNYTFRLYSLLLLGAILIATGLMAALQSARLGPGGRIAWRASLSVWLVILAINLPLMPLQRFAILFSVLAALAVLLLVASRQIFDANPREL
jgi:hypothetical protein